MKVNERLEIIIQEVQEKGQVKVSELSEMLGCSEVTIRNDIRKLDEQGVLKKNYGGASRLDIGMTVHFLPGEFYLNANEKKKIAEKAFEYIENHDSVMLDDSTTCCYLAQRIKDQPQKKISVVTNSLYAAALLAPEKHIKVHLLGGQINSTPASVMDNVTVDCADKYYVNKLFTGINRINLRVGMTSTDSSHAQIKRTMISRADETYVLADHTKFGGSSLFIVCTMDKIKRVITDAGVSSDIVDLASQLKIHLDVAL